MALLFGFVGLFANPFLMFVALFVWLGAQAEASGVRMRDSVPRIPVREVMLVGAPTLAAVDPLGRAVELALAGAGGDLPVVEDGRPVGVLTRADLVAGLSRAGPDGRVGDAMHRGFATADP